MQKHAVVLDAREQVALLRHSASRLGWFPWAYLVNGCYPRCPTRGLFSELIISISELGQPIVEPALKAR